LQTYLAWVAPLASSQVKAVNTDMLENHLNRISEIARSNNKTTS